MAATGVGIIGQAVGNAAISAASNVHSHHTREHKPGEKKFDLMEFGISAASGFASGLAGGNGAKFARIKFGNIRVGKYAMVGRDVLKGFKPSARLQRLRLFKGAAQNFRVSLFGAAGYGSYRRWVS